MKKFWVLTFGLAVMGVTAYGIARPSYEMQNLLEFSELFVIGRIMMILLLVSYVFIEQLRLPGFRLLLGAASLAMLSLGISTIVSPTLYGYFTNYLPLGDTVIFLEGGILGLLLAFELPLYRSNYGRRYATTPYRLNRTVHSSS